MPSWKVWPLTEVPEGLGRQAGARTEKPSQEMAAGSPRPRNPERKLQNVALKKHLRPGLSTVNRRLVGGPGALRVRVCGLGAAAGRASL